MNIKNIASIPKQQLGILTRPRSKTGVVTKITISSKCTCTKCHSLRRKLYLNDTVQERDVSIQEYAEIMFKFSKVPTCGNWFATPEYSEATTDLKEWGRCTIGLYATLIEMNFSHKGVMMDVDLDDLIANTGYDIETIRAALKNLHNQGVIYQRIHPKDHKLVDVILWGYEDSLKKTGNGYLTMNSEEYKNIMLAKSGLASKLCLIGLEITDAGRGENEIASSTIKERTLPYVRNYQLKRLMTNSKDSTMLQEMFNIKLREKEHKELHKKSITRTIYRFFRQLNNKSFKDNLVKEVAEKLDKFLTITITNRCEHYSLTLKSIDKIISKFTDDAKKKISNLAISFSPDLVWDGIVYSIDRIISYLVGKQDQDVANVSSYISKCLQDGFVEDYIEDHAQTI